MSPCSIDRSEGERLSGHYICKSCNGPLPHCRSIDVTLEHTTGIDKPLTFVAGGFPGIMCRDLLQRLDPEVIQRDLFLGRVFGPNGKLLDQWVTFHGRRTLIIRGTQHAGHRVCDMCHRVLYFATGLRYLFLAPPADATIFESDLSGLIFPAAMYHKIDLGKWRKKIHADELQVVDEPLDGLGTLVTAGT